MDKPALSGFGGIEYFTPLEGRKVQHVPSALYNRMINPLVGYNSKVMLWYQGENKVKEARRYKKLFPAMINSWRDKWSQPEMPFYFVQIAPFKYLHDDNMNKSAFLRETQLYTMQYVKNTGMVMTLDVGDCNVIDPADKKIVGERLSYWALANNYGIDGVAYSGPVYRKMEKTEDGRITLHFDYATNGLVSFGEKPDGFTIAGADHVFYPAQAIINKKGIITVWADSVLNPLAVRYAFEDCPQATLFNTAGLPASSFRTDNWEE